MALVYLTGVINLRPLRDQATATQLRLVFFYALVLLLLVPAIGLMGQADADSDERSHVLVLYSYDAHYPTASETIGALSDQLQSNGYLFEVEYLNAVGNWSPRMRSAVARYLSERLAHSSPYDLVVIVHDQALNLLLREDKELFSETPIIFGGLNDAGLQQLAVEHEGMTGVVGPSPLTTTSKAVKMLLPELSALYLISDYPVENVYTQKQLTELQEALGDVPVRELLLHDMRFSELTAQLQDIDPDAAILPVEFRRDVNWTRLPTLTALSLIVESSPAPVFSLLRAGPEAGSVGGAYIDGEALGIHLGELANKVLSSPNAPLPSPIPIDSRYRFSRTSLQSLSISARDLPVGSEVVPAVSVVLSENPRVVLSMLIVLASLIVLVLSLLVALKYRGRRNTELRAANEATESAMRARSQFMANISHELRTPLNGISGISQVLASTELDEEQRSLLRMLESSTRDLTVLINGLLDFTNSESGRLKTAAVEFSLLSLAQEAVRLTEIEAAKKQLSVDYRFEFDPEHVFLGDPHKVKQILLNLTDNAVKFTTSGSVELIATELPGNQGKVWIEFHVNDNGPGIEKEQVSRVFDAFHQADLSSGKQHGGLGIGLALAKSLTTILGGEITVVSRVNHGSSFRVRLPFTPATHETAPGRHVR